MVDNIFVNKFKNENYSVSPLINGLSDHDDQALAYSILLLQMTLMNFILIAKSVNTHYMNFRLA